MSAEIRQFYSGLSADEQSIIEMVEASNHTEGNYTAVYKEFNEALGQKAEEYVNKEAAKILKLETTARNFYLQILQLPNKLKQIEGGKEEDWKQMAKEVLVQYEKLGAEAKATFKAQHPEVVETLDGKQFVFWRDVEESVYFRAILGISKTILSVFIEEAYGIWNNEQRGRFSKKKSRVLGKSFFELKEEILEVFWRQFGSNWENQILKTLS